VISAEACPIKASIDTSEIIYVQLQWLPNPTVGLFFLHEFKEAFRHTEICSKEGRNLGTKLRPFPHSLSYTPTHTDTHANTDPYKI
jgi:hypothetical protein